MNVSLVAQTICASVASAIDFQRNELSLPQFQDSEARTEFINHIDLAFDLNSGNPFVKGTNQPMILEYFPKWTSEFDSLASYIFDLRGEKGCFLQNQKTVTLGCTITIKSLKAVTEKLIQRESLPTSMFWLQILPGSYWIVPQ